MSSIMSVLTNPLLPVIIILLAFWIQQQMRRRYGWSILSVQPQGPCVDDPPIRLEVPSASTITIDPCYAFSETYEEARGKFREAAVKLVGPENITSLEIVGPTYTTDIAVIKGTLPGLVVHTSGVHGVEGYAGSAIQLAWMHQLSSLRTTKNTPIGMGLPTIVLVHAVNPWGMAHFRRVNENNVDLNRNGLHPQGWKEVLARDKNIAGYEDLTEAFNPTDRNYNFWSTLAHRILFDLGVAQGIQKLKSGLVSGQYHNPKGISYGGTELQPSLKKLYDFFDTTLLPQLEKTTPYQKGKVTWIDVHTGLGPSGVDTMLVDMNLSLEERRKIGAVYTNARVPGLGDADGDAVAKGYEITRGMVPEFIPPLFSSSSSASDVWVMAQEFGTIPSILVGRSLIFENMIFQYYRDNEKDVLWGQHLLKTAFYRQTSKWRKAIILRGVEIMDQSIARSSSSVALGI